MNNQRGDASSPHGYPENVPNSGFNVQTYVSPTIEDIIDEDAVTEGVAGEDDSGTHTAKYGIVETYGDDNDDDAYVPLHTTASESDDISAGEKDEGHTTDHEEADSDHAPGASLTFHRDTSHIPKHTQNCPTTLFSAINLSHYLKYKIGNALHSTVTGLNHIKNAIKTAVDRLRAILGPNFENAPQIIFNSAKEAVAWIKANPKTTVFIVVCLVGVIVPAIYVIPVLAGAGFGAGGVVAGKNESLPLPRMCSCILTDTVV